MKLGALDAIREEPGARAEERAPSRRGQAEPGALVTIPSAASRTGPELPSGDGAPHPAPEGPGAPWKPAEEANFNQSAAAAKGPGLQGPGVGPALLLLSKQKGKVTTFLAEPAQSA